MGPQWKGETMESLRLRALAQEAIGATQSRLPFLLRRQTPRS